MSGAIKVILAQNLKIQLCQYLKAYAKFATIISISISPTSDMLFSVVNENGSCYSSLKLHASRLIRQLSADIDPSSVVFSQAYPQPLKSFLYHLEHLRPSSELLLLEFTPFTMNLGSEPCEGVKGSWRSTFPPISIENPIYPPLETFPVCISGFSVEWFHFLVEGVSSTGLLTKSTLILKASPATGLKLILPGPINQAEIEVGSFNFGSFRIRPNEIEGGVVVSLREMAALMTLASNLNSLIDIYFGSPLTGHPLVAVLSSIGAFECKFVMATISLPENEKIQSAKFTDENEDEYISGTDDEE